MQVLNIAIKVGLQLLQRLVRVSSNAQNIFNNGYDSQLLSHTLQCDLGGQVDQNLALIEIGSSQRVNQVLTSER